MSQRATDLASRLEKTNDDVIALVESLSEGQWRGTTNEEGWTVAATAHHIAATYGAVVPLIQGLASGATIPPIPLDFINDGNAKHAADFKDCNREETIALLRDGGKSATQMIGGLSDEGLDRTAQLLQDGPELTTEQVIEGVLISHAEIHATSIREVL